MANPYSRNAIHRGAWKGPQRPWLRGKVEAPAWKPLEEMHPCDLQSSMIKGCTPVANTSDPADFYSIGQRKKIRSVVGRGRVSLLTNLDT